MFFFATITSLGQFKRELTTIDNLTDLNAMRDTVRGYQDREDPHPLNQGPKWGFSLVYKALDTRAEELGFNKYSAGYYKPLQADGQKT